MSGRGGQRAGAGAPVTTGRATAGSRAVTLRLSASEDAQISSAAGGRRHVGRFLRDAALAVLAIEGALSDDPPVAIDKIRKIIAWMNDS